MIYPEQERFEHSQNDDFHFTVIILADQHFDVNSQLPQNWENQGLSGLKNFQNRNF